MPYKNSNSNPFSPQFGRKPQSFIGRQQLVDELIHELYEQNSPARVTIISGVRGSGKTALLSDITEQLGKDKNWLIINTSFSEHLLENIASLLKSKIHKYPFALKNINLGVGGIGFSLERDRDENFQSSLLSMAEELSAQGIGILFTIDEVKSSEELKEFAATYQLLVREKLDVALIMAGLPHFVLSLLSTDVLTFLHRGNQLFLRSIDPFAFKIEYKSIFQKTNRPFTDEALDLAYLSTGGYPYLYQLIGYYLWNNKEKESTIDLEMVQQAVDSSKILLFQNVYSLAISDLSKREQEYLLVLAKAGGTAKTELFEHHTGKKASYWSVYRKSLIYRGLIESPAYGFVKFTLPFFGDYLLEQEKQGNL